MGAGVSNVQKTGNENVDKTIKKMAVLGALKATGNDTKVVKTTSESGDGKEDIYEFVRRQKADREESAAALENETYEGRRRSSVLPTDFDDDEEERKRLDLLYEVSTKNPDDLITNYCGVCKAPTILRIDGWPCRVCGQTFHKQCLAKCGKYTTKDLEMFERAKTPIGWSCEKCDNILNLLPQDELDMLSAAFEEFDINRDSSVSLEEYLAYRRRQWYKEEGYDMPPEEEEFEKTKFRILDDDGNGSIDYWEFAKNEACKSLAKMPKDDLVALLSPLEQLSARRIYDILDDDQNGFITEEEARDVFRTWYGFLEQKPERSSSVADGGKSEMMKPEVASMSERHATRQASLMLDADEDGDRTLTWREFLKTQALYILCSRPNKTRVR